MFEDFIDSLNIEQLKNLKRWSFITAFIFTHLFMFFSGQLYGENQEMIYLNDLINETANNNYNTLQDYKGNIYYIQNFNPYECILNNSTPCQNFNNITKQLSLNR